MGLRNTVIPASESVVAALRRRRERDERRDEVQNDWPAWRKRLNYVVRKDPTFERVIFVFIVGNCITISLENLVPNQDALDGCEAAFTLIFLAEMFIKIVARGAFGSFGYFSTNTNRFDFLLVVASTYGLLQAQFFPSFDVVPAFTATAARSARLLRPLRTVSILGSLRMVLDSISASAPRLGHLLLLTLLFALTVGLVALQFFRGVLKHRCVVPDVNATTDQVCVDPLDLYNVSSFGFSAVQGYVCPWGSSCEDVGNPGDGFLNFDNILPTGTTLFSTLMLEDWASVMYDVVNAKGLLAQIYFLVLVLVGTMFLLNLVLATVSDAFTTTLAALRDEEQRNEPRAVPASTALWRMHFVNVVKHPVFIYGFSVLTVVNAGLLGAVYEGMPKDAEEGLTFATVVLAFIFLVETLLKVLAKPFRDFISDPLNPFDALLSLASIVEFFVLGTASINALRSVRLLRLLEVSASMRETLKTLRAAFTTAAPLLLLLALVLFLFAMLGMQLFAGRFCGADFNPLTSVNTTKCDFVPRLNYDNVGYALLTTFTIIVGDGWQQIMTTSMRARGEYTVFYFVACVLVGGLLMINLIAALLIQTTMACREDQDKKEALAVVDSSDNEDDAAVVLFLLDKDAAAKRAADQAAAEKGSNGVGGGNSGRTTDVVFGMDAAAVVSEVEMRPMPTTPGQAPANRSTPVQPIANGSMTAKPLSNGSMAASGGHLTPRDGKPAGEAEKPKLKPKPKRKRAETTLMYDRIDESAFLDLDRTLLEESNEREELRRQEAVEAGKNPLRRVCRRIVNSRVFSGFIILTILFSIAAMCVTLPLAAPNNEFNRFLDYTDIACAGVFVLDVLLKLCWLGPYSRDAKTYGKGYFQRRWHCFDFFVTLAAVAAAVLVLVGEAYLAKWLRVFRVLRPWSLVGRSRQTMMVFRSLVAAMGSMSNLAIIATAVWVMYAILGTQVFRGTTFACTEREWGDQSYGGFEIYERDECLQRNFSWVHNKRNFDHLGESMLTLFGVATTDMWTDVMLLNTDGSNRDEAPRDYRRPFMCLYTISFIVVVNFFLLNMTVSVLVEAYLRTKRLVEASLRKSLFHQGKIDALTEAQQDFVDMYRRALVFVKPPLRPPYAATSWRRHFRRVVRKKYYPYAYIVLVLASIVVQATAFAEMPPIYGDLLVVLDAVFTAVFWASMVCNMIGYGVREYVSNATTRLELGVNVVTGAAVIARFVTGPNDIVDLLRILRVFRLQRVFAVSTKLRLFLDTLMTSSATCVAVFFLVFLVFFMYAAIGMHMFSAVKRGKGITRLANFERIDTALVTLLRVATFDDWQYIMWDCAVKPPECDPHIGECGQPGWAQLYFFSFIAFGQWIGLNFFTAVLLDAFARSEREDRMAVQMADVKEFRATWKRFSHNDQMPVPLMPLFLRKLGPPLGPKPDESSVKLVTNLDSLMAVSNEVFQADVFDALLRHFYGEMLPPSSEESLRRLLSQTFLKRTYGDTCTAMSCWPARTVGLVIRIQSLWRGRCTRRRAGASPSAAASTTHLGSTVRFGSNGKSQERLAAEMAARRRANGALPPVNVVGESKPLDCDGDLLNYHSPAERGGFVL